MTGTAVAPTFTLPWNNRSLAEVWAQESTAAKPAKQVRRQRRPRRPRELQKIPFAGFDAHEGRWEHSYLAMRRVDERSDAL